MEETISLAVPKESLGKTRGSLTITALLESFQEYASMIDKGNSETKKYSTKIYSNLWYRFPWNINMQGKDICDRVEDILYVTWKTPRTSDSGNAHRLVNSPREWHFKKTSSHWTYEEIVLEFKTGHSVCWSITKHRLS